MTKVTCSVKRNGKEVTQETVDGNSKAVARNAVMMKLSSSDKIDWDSDEFTIDCR